MLSRNLRVGFLKPEVPGFWSSYGFVQTNSTAYFPILTNEIFNDLEISNFDINYGPMNLGPDRNGLRPSTGTKYPGPWSNIFKNSRNFTQKRAYFEIFTRKFTANFKNKLKIIFFYYALTQPYLSTILPVGLKLTFFISRADKWA